MQVTQCWMNSPSATDLRRAVASWAGITSLSGVSRSSAAGGVSVSPASAARSCSESVSRHTASEAGTSSGRKYRAVWPHSSANELCRLSIDGGEGQSEGYGAYA